jgi:hypothetical protein
MKKISGIIILTLGFISFYQSPTLASEYMSDEDCAVLSGKAYTDYAAREIYWACGSQVKVFLSVMYDQELKCAIKAGKARTEDAARNIIYDCDY